MIVGSVEIEIRAVSDQAAVTKQISDGLQRPATTAGKAAGRTMGRHIGDSAAAELEKSGARFARSGQLLSNVFTSNSAQALGPLQEVADRIGLIGSTLEQTRTKAGGAFLGIGAAATGIGAFLLTLQSREQGAHNQLAAAIEAQGGSIDEYEKRIGKAVKSGERFGYSANQTIDALKDLTLGLHDPKLALDSLGTAENVAAAKHVSLASAANILRQGYNGNTRVLKAFGIQLSSIVDGEKLVKDAHDRASTAATNASKAQQDYTDKLAIYKDTLHPTLAQQIAFTTSHEKLVKAQQEQAAAAAALTDAQKKANDAGSKGAQVVAAFADVTNKQAAAAADTFTGHLKAYGAAIEDNAAKIGGPAGKALVEFGPALAAGGFLIESGLIPKLARGVLALLGFGGEATATAGVVEGASVAEVASFDTVVSAIGELQLALTGIGPAMTAQTVVVEENAAAQAAALDKEAASAKGLRAILATLGGATLGIVGAGALVAIKEARDTNALTGSLDKQVRQLHDLELHAQTSSDLQAAINAAVAKARSLGVVQDAGGNILELNASAKNANQRSRGEQILRDALAAKKFLALPGSGPDSNAQDAKDAAHASIVAGLTSHVAAPKAAKPLTLQERIAQALRDAGLDPTLASSSLNKALSEHQKAAGERARAIGATVTAGIRANVATVKHEISGLTAELKKIADVRAQAIGQAGSFTSLTGLLPDNSLATSGGLVAGLQSRVGAESLFGKNITALSKRGLDKGVISEILAAGPEQGRAIAAALMAGGNDQIRQLNLAEKAARQQAQVLGNDAVNAQFGVNAQAKANAELAKHTAYLAAIEKRLAAEPALIAKAVDQAQRNNQVTRAANSRTAVIR